jgi:hypothetical protein
VEDTKTTFRSRNGAETMEWVKVIGETISVCSQLFSPSFVILYANNLFSQTVNPEFLFDVSSYLPRNSPRTPRASRTTSFLNLLSRDESPLLASSHSTSAIPRGDVNSNAGAAPPSPRSSGLSPREERKKYSFLTLRSSKKKVRVGRGNRERR